MTPKNPKRKAYRDPAHPFHSHYLAHQERMYDRSRKPRASQPNARRYHIAGENGASVYQHKDGKVVKASKRISGMLAAIMATALGGMPKTGIQRQQ